MCKYVSSEDETLLMLCLISYLLLSVCAGIDKVFVMASQFIVFEKYPYYHLSKLMDVERSFSMYGNISSLNPQRFIEDLSLHMVVIFFFNTN